jgi:hypothetical protein
VSIGEKQDETEDLERLCQGVSPNEIPQCEGERSSTESSLVQYQVSSS